MTMNFQKLTQEIIGHLRNHFYRHITKQKIGNVKRNTDWQSCFPGEQTKTDRIISVPNDFITGVFIGLKTPNEYKDEIMEVFNTKQIPVY